MELGILIIMVRYLIFVLLLRGSVCAVTWPRLRVTKRLPSSMLCIKCNTQEADSDCNVCSACCDRIACKIHGPKLKAAILAKTTDVQKAAAIERSNRIPKGRFREPNFKYQGDTVVIWDIREFRRNPEWRKEAMKKAFRQLKYLDETTALRLKSSRKRFHRVIQELYKKLGETR